MLGFERFDPTQGVPPAKPVELEQKIGLGSDVEQHIGALELGALRTTRERLEAERSSRVQVDDRLEHCAYILFQDDLLQQFLVLDLEPVGLDSRHPPGILDELQHQPIVAHERIVKHQTVADPQLRPTTKVTARNPIDASRQVGVDPIGHRFQIATTERTVFPLLAQENEKDVSVLLVDRYEIIATRLNALHFDDEVRQGVQNFFVDLRPVVMLDLGERRSVHIEKRKRTVLGKHLPDLVHLVAVRGHVAPVKPS